MIARIDTPIGEIRIRTENDRVQQIYLPTNPDGQAADFASPSGKVAALLTQLKRYFAGQSHEFDLAVLATCGTPFQQRVRQLCAEIPLGETRRYAELADCAGSPRAARAVGSVMAGNPYPIVIGCCRRAGSGATRVDWPRSAGCWRTKRRCAPGSLHRGAAENPRG